MSRQLQISSLLSALALVCLCLVVSVRDHQAGEEPAVQSLVQAETAPGLNS